MREPSDVGKFRKNKMEPGEQVLASCVGYIGDIFGTGERTQRNGAAIVTNTRVVFYSKGLLSELFKELRALEINLETHTTLIHHRLTFSASSAEALTFKTFDGAGAKDLARGISARRLGAAAPRSPSATSVTSMANAIATAASSAVVGTSAEPIGVLGAAGAFLRRFIAWLVVLFVMVLPVGLAKDAPAISVILALLWLGLALGSLTKFAQPLWVFFGGQGAERAPKGWLGSLAAFGCLSTLVTFIVTAAEAETQQSASQHTAASTTVAPSASSPQPVTLPKPQPAPEPDPEQERQRTEEARRRRMEAIAEAETIAKGDRCTNLKSLRESWDKLRATPKDVAEYKRAKAAVSGLERCRKRSAIELEKATELVMRTQREGMGGTLDKIFLDLGMDVQVAVNGKDKDRVTLTHIYFGNRAVLHKMTESGDLLETLQKVGFRTATFSDGFDKAFRYDLHPAPIAGQGQAALEKTGLGTPMDL